MCQVLLVKMYQRYLLLVILSALVALSAAQNERGEIGEFETLAHGVSGTVHILGSRKLYFQNFNYDGNGPDTVLYYYAPGVAVDAAGGGVVIDLPRNSRIGDEMGRFKTDPYVNENFMVTLPEGNSTCRIGTLAVWCRQARVLFGTISIPRSAFLNNGQEPCAAIGSAEVGAIETLAHEVSGTLHILDPRTIYLENFNYDGRGPDTLLYYYAPGTAVNAAGGGANISLAPSVGDSQGRFQMRRFEDESIVVTLPEGTNACDIGSLTVWCREAQVLFGQIEIPRSTFANDGQSPCTVIADGSGGLLLNPPEIDLSAERGRVGDFNTRAHGVSGTVHILSSKKIYLENFNYDGQGPDTVLYYYAPGVAVDAAGGGVVIDLPRNSQVGDDQGRFQMRRYTNEGILVTLPDEVNTCEMGAIAVWCRQASVLFADLLIPRRAFVNNGADPCASIGSAEIGEMETLAHEASGTVHVLDSRTIYLENFNYDGQGPDTLLYSYRPGQPVNPRGGGTFIPLPPGSRDSRGRFQTRRYTNEDIIVTLPQGMSTCDIGYLTVWCRQANVTFGQILIPTTTFANTGDSSCTVIGDGSGGLLLNAPEFDNCMVLDDTLQLSWRVDNANSQVRFRLCGCESQEIGTNQYMGFGLSGSVTQTSMFGADPTITWVDTSSTEANAVDYHLSAYRRCNNGVGACPDTLDSRGGCTNDVSDVTGTTSAGQQCVSFTRPMSSTDSVCDKVIDPSNQNQYIVWGIGRLTQEAVEQHFTRASSSQAPIHLGRMPRDDCARAQLVCRSCEPFENEQIVARESTTFQARIGPAGSERGYMGITGRAGWGINWYINGTLIPELVVERGNTYTFMVEGGDNPNDESNYHPFYITDSIDGGRLRNSQQMQNSERVFAGITENGAETTVTVGALCEYTETLMSETMRETCDAGLAQYVNSLELSASSQCRSSSGQPGKLEWTPDKDTPDVVYYQCATHQNLGWRIVVRDSHAPALHAVSLLVVLIVSGLVGLFLL